jgi:uncharacterized protein
MIDCHAHAYPTLDYQAARLATRMPAPAGALLEQGAALLGSAIGVLQRWSDSGRASERPSLGIEQVARMQAGRSERANQMMEGALSALAFPALLANGTLERLLASMDRFGVERTVLIGAPPLASNEWLLGDAVAAAGDRIIPVATLPEGPDRASATEDVWIDAWAAAADAGARGLKIHLNMDGLPAGHLAYRAAFEVASAHDLFVIVHTGCFHVLAYKDGRPSEPDALEPLYADYPGVRVCLAHMNRAHPERCWQVMRRHEQVFTDTSWQPVDAIRAAIAEIGADRILLGSDWPLLHDGLQGDAIDLLRRATDADTAERIGTANARAFLGV